MSQDKSVIAAKQRDQGQLLKREFKKYLKYWYLFLISVCIAMAIGFIYLRYTVKIYSSVAKIKVLNKTKGLELPSAAFVFNSSNINLENEIEILKSYRIIEQVVQKLDLNIKFYEEGNLLTTEIDRLPFSFIKNIDSNTIDYYESYTVNITKAGFQIFKNNSETPMRFVDYTTIGATKELPFDIRIEGQGQITNLIGKTFIIRFTPVEAETKRLKNDIEVSALGKGSDLIKLGYKSESKFKSERVLDALIFVFNNDGITDRQDISKRTIAFIDERFGFLAGELDSIETEKKDFKQSNDFFSIESSAELGISQRTAIETEVFEIDKQLMLAKMLRESFKDMSTSYDLLPSNIGLADVNVNTLIGEYNKDISQRNQLVVSAGDNNPTMQLLNSRIDELKRNINASLLGYASQLKAAKEQLNSRNQRFVSQVASIPSKEKLLRAIDRQQEIKESLFVFLLQKREEAAINLAITEPSIKVVEYALSDGGYLSPTPKNAYLMALALGLLVPFGFVYVFNFLDTKIQTKQDVEQRVPEIPIVAELPKFKDKDLIFIKPSDQSLHAEAFRILSSNVDFLLPENSQEGKVIYSTSTIKGEGKTYVSINLSLALSSLNKKVLLIGADLRNPQIHNRLALKKNQLGLSNYLHDYNLDWKSLVVEGFSNHPEHRTLLSGDIPPNPAHLLTNKRFEDLVAEAKTLYDYIIIDTAPTILVTDTMLISKYADVTLYVLRANYTESNLLEYSQQLNATGKLNNMAYVLNGVDSKSSYGYGYNYGYGYGYGSKE